MLTGKSGNYRTIFILAPTHNQTITFNFTPCTDSDSNHYAIVHIDTMTWMAENLKTTKYRNGTLIPNVTSNSSWGNLTTGAYCDYNNDTSISKIYGRLYNWYAVIDTSNICPQGWHVPSNSEFSSLSSFLGQNDGGKLKATCNSNWFVPNVGATNESGFTALPSGYRLHSGTFYYLYYRPRFWPLLLFLYIVPGCFFIENISGNTWGNADNYYSGFCTLW